MCTFPNVDKYNRMATSLDHCSNLAISINNKNNFSLITGIVKANQTIWVLGDNLLNDAAGHYQQFKPKPNENPSKETLYMEKRYAVKRFTPGSYGHDKNKPYNAPLSITGSYIDALNDPENAKIPDIVAILWNDYRFWNNHLLLKNHMTKILHKLFKEIKKITEIRNFALPEKASKWNCPRIFVSKPLPLPNNMSGRYPPNFKANRRKFIKLLQKSSAKNGFTLVNFDEFSCENTNNLFHNNGSISEEGYHYIWKALSNAIESSDKAHEVAARKVKAKQLAAAPLTSPQTSSDKNQLSGIWPLEHQDQQKETVSQNIVFNDCPSPQRSLLIDFNKSKGPAATAPNPDTSHDQSAKPSQTFPTRNKQHHHKNKRGRGRGYH